MSVLVSGLYYSPGNNLISISSAFKDFYFLERYVLKLIQMSRRLNASATVFNWKFEFKLYGFLPKAIFMLKGQSGRKNFC